MNQPYESTLRINPTNQPYESTLRINPPYQGGQGGSNLKSIQPYESTLGINPPYQGGQGGSNLKSIFNLIITSYLGFTEKVFTGGRV